MKKFILALLLAFSFLLTIPIQAANFEISTKKEVVKALVLQTDQVVSVAFEIQNQNFVFYEVQKELFNTYKKHLNSDFANLNKPISDLKIDLSWCNIYKEKLNSNYIIDKEKLLQNLGIKAQRISC
jgi:hypothetical protein